MHGTLIHKLYEVSVHRFQICMTKWLMVVQHEVTPAGMLRFAITSRFIHPPKKSLQKKKAIPAAETPSAEAEARQSVGETPSDKCDILPRNIKTLAYKGDS